MARHHAPPPGLGEWPRGLGWGLLAVVGLALGWVFWRGTAPTPLTNAPPKNARIACFGDSLVVGVGADQVNDSFPARLAAQLGREVQAFGKSGETAVQALNRLETVAQHDSGIVIVTLGGNDILQRVGWQETASALRQIFTGLQARGAVVVFTGVTGPLNPGRGKEYRRLCDELGVLYIPEILAGILGNPDLKADPIHPNSAGYALVTTRIAQALRRAKLVD